ncbi:MAG: hypothetical protein K0U45_03485 [Alphaproteobacteria bacterium]|nr:hypothetical protein [Alphaproteobacteria bacterium]
MGNDTKKIQLFFEDGKEFSLKNIKPLVGITGLYLIYNSDIKIRYPFKSSRLIYIGMSEKRTSSIGKRLQGHLEGTSGNEGIVSYNKVDNLLFTYINFEMLKNIWTLSIENLESFFILDFVKHYGVYPICNNKSGYDLLSIEKNLDITINWESFE